MVTILMNLDTYRRYRALARERNYCEPWMPYHGDHYGDGKLPTFVYCGAAAWWDSAHDFPEDDDTAMRKTQALTDEFVEDGMYDTAFWRLYWRLLDELRGDEISRDAAVRRSVWTNLSKLGRVGVSAPPHDDLDLRKADIEQMQNEVSVLHPDFMVCVSGSMLPQTGYSLFQHWQEIESLQPRTKDTWFRCSPWGGVLMWTMHPSRKSSTWMDDVVGDFRELVKNDACSNWLRRVQERALGKSKNAD